MPSRPLLLSLSLVLVTIAGGLAVRFAPLCLPALFVKFGGSALWALMVCWIVSALFPALRLAAAALLAAGVATAVECGKLYHAPALDTFRRTLPGVLLLGRFFSVGDIVVYACAIAAGVYLDGYIRHRLRR